MASVPLVNSVPVHQVSTITPAGQTKESTTEPLNLLAFVGLIWAPMLFLCSQISAYSNSFFVGTHLFHANQTVWDYHRGKIA